MRVLYPLVRLARAGIVAQTTAHVTHSTATAVTLGVFTDAISIVADSRPFFSNASQFWLAAVFLPWFFESYWQSFVSVSRVESYELELVLLLAASGFEFAVATF